MCMSDFLQEREIYRHKYPFWGDLLTVRGISTHYATGEQLLTFEETAGQLPIPLAAGNFKELQTPEEGQAIIGRVMKLLTK